MSAALVALFAPYCEGVNRPEELSAALELMASGGLDGHRPLRPSGFRPFSLRWQPAVAPLEPAQVALRVASGSAEEQPVEYSFNLPTYQLVRWLMDWQAAGGASAQADLPASFWQWLLLGLDTNAVRA